MELGQITAAFDRAREGRGESLRLIAPAGFGKTALTEAAAAVARRDGQVLRTRGVEAELDLPFSGLQTLLRPLAGQVAELDPHDQALLEAILALREIPAAAEVGIGMATLNLLSLAAASAPLLAVIDDLHWMDSATVPVLVFLTRRIEFDPITFLFAGRPQKLAGDLIARQVELGPLSVPATGRLVAKQLGRPVPNEVAASVAAATGGNPLAIIETVRRLGPDVLARGSELDEPVPLDELIARGLASRLDRLDDDTLAALRVLATMLDHSPATLQRALGQLDRSIDDLAQAEADGIIESEPGTVAFSHPLLRSLVYHGTSKTERRRAHAALSTVVPDPGARAWHAASASATEDEALAAALADHATTFAARGGHVAAAKALALAAQLTPEPDARDARLLDAAEEARWAGRSAWSLELSGRVAASPDATLRLRAQRAQTVVLGYSARTSEVCTNLYEHVLASKEVDLDLRREIFFDLSNRWLVEGEMAKSRLAIQAASALGPSAQPEVQEAFRLCVAHAELLSAWDPLTAAANIRALNLRSVSNSLSIHMWCAVIGEALSWIEDHDAAVGLTKRFVTEGRESGNLRLVGTNQSLLGYLHYRRGEWHDALVPLDEACRITDATSQRWDLFISEATVALIECSRGEPGAGDRARALDVRLRADGYPMLALYTACAIGLSELAEGRPAGAIADLERARDVAINAEWIEPGLLPWPADLAEAYVGAGRLDDARVAIGWLTDLAERTKRPWAQAAVARLEALLAGDDFEGAFAHAFERYDRTLAPFDVARLHLAYGRRLRRVKRRADARVELEAALVAFEQLGAPGWIEQTKAELRAAGVRVAAERSEPGAALTAQESVVAELVAQGLPNKAIAAQLFLTPKTVEWHLGQIFRKLGLRSRVQLAEHVRHTAPADA